MQQYIAQLEQWIESSRTKCEYIIAAQFVTTVLQLMSYA